MSIGMHREDGFDRGLEKSRLEDDILIFKSQLEKFREANYQLEKKNADLKLEVEKYKDRYEEAIQ